MKSIPPSFGFTIEWYKLGIVDDATVTEHAAAMTRNNENNPLHYRWRAFKSFLARHDSLPDHLLTDLYHLADAEEDRTLGTSMMTEILKRRECPDKLSPPRHRLPTPPHRPLRRQPPRPMVTTIPVHATIPLCPTSLFDVSIP